MTYKRTLTSALFIAGVAGTIYGIIRVVQSAVMIAVTTQAHKEDLHLLLLTCILITGFSLAMACIALLLDDVFRSHDRIHALNVNIDFRNDMINAIKNGKDIVVIMMDDYDKLDFNGLDISGVTFTGESNSD